VSPRLGLAWNPKGTGDVSIRAGFGLFHEPLLMRYYINSMDRQPPFWSDVDPNVSDLAGLFPNLNPHLERLSQGPQAVHVFEFHPTNPYAMQWNLSVQRMLAADLVSEIGYTGSRGVHLAGRKEYAVPVPSSVDGDTFYAATTTALFNPAFTRFNYYDTSASSKYHSLRVTVAKRYSAGLHFQAGYTWSKATDTQSATLSGELGDNTVMDPFDPKRDWGLAEFHVTHSFGANLGYELPWGATLTGFAGGLTRGWQVSGIFVATTGTPLLRPEQRRADPHAQSRRIAARSDSRREQQPNPRRPGPLLRCLAVRGAAGGVLRQPGTEHVIGPGMTRLDISVLKNQPLRQGQNLQFRAEFFNLLNEPNFSLPSATLFDSRGRPIGSAGRIDRTVTNARQAQLAVRFEF
jgi:hypothetical protein